MPIATCQVCGSRGEFYQQDGFYFCEECNTQSQSIREFEEEEEYHSFSEKSFSLRIKSGGSSAESEKTDDGKSKKSLNWWTHEVFQLIIKEQVEALIKLGVSPKLRPVVRQIWFKYLSKAGIAFCPDPKPGKRRKFARHRDVKMENEWLKKQQEMMDSDSSSRLTLSELASSSAEEDSAEEEDNAENAGAEGDGAGNAGAADAGTDGPRKRPKVEQDVEAASASGTKKEDEREEETTNNSDSDIDDDNESTVKLNGLNYVLERMCLHFTICFVYIGVLIIQEPLFLSDILRLTKEGYFPFTDIDKFLPKHIKFELTDSNTFLATEIPTIQSTMLVTGLLCKYLDLPKFPPINLRLLISRHILDLNLPSEMHQLCNKLVVRHNPSLAFKAKTRNSKIPYYEGIAMAYIIVTLKVLFGLDDSTEYKLSDLAKELQQSQTNGVSLFIWDEWMNAMHLREKQRLSSCMPRRFEDLEHLTDFTYLTDHFAEEESHKKRHGGRKAMVKTPKARTEIQRPFLKLAATYRQEGDAAGKAKPGPTSFMYPAVSGNPAASSSLLTKNFRRCTLAHIVTPEKFYAGEESQSRTDSSQGSDSSDEEEFRKLNNLNFPRNYPTSVAHKNYVHYLGFVKNGRKPKPGQYWHQYHHSYTMLLHLAANLIGATTIHQLHREVDRLEQIIVDNDFTKARALNRLKESYY